MKIQQTIVAVFVLLLPALPALTRAQTQVPEVESVSSGILTLGEQTALLINTEVTMNVSGMLVRTNLAQSFRNDTPYWQEGVYVFPLPDDASVDTLEMKLNERVVKGVIKKHDEAAIQYEQAVASGQQASLIAQQRANLFTTRVGNIPPGETIDISIAFQSDVHYDDGIFSLHFPTTITPRYIPGARLSTNEPLQEYVETGSKGWSNMAGISPPMTTADDAPQTSITVEINAGIPLQSIYSTSHQIISSDISGAGQNNSRWHVRLANATVPTDRDFRLSWVPPLGQSPRAAVFREDRVNNDDNSIPPATSPSTSTYASVMLLPPQQLFDGDRPAREVIFVIDTSGSMQGSSIVQARKALAFGIERLSDQDSFNVIAFDDSATSLFREVKTVTAARQSQAIDWINRLQADGGTEIAKALQMALHNTDKETSHNASRFRQVVFVTDGSVGNEEEIFHYLGTHLGRSRLFTVGIGSAPNTWFMRKAAEVGRGSYTFIASARDVHSNMLQLFNKLERPVLTDIRLEVFGAPAPEQYPYTIPDLYAGEPIVADMHWEQGITSAEIRISGDHIGQAWSRNIDLPLHDDKSTKLAKRFARAKIESLEDSRLFSDRPDNIIAQITDTAMEYGLVTNYTSLIAVENKVVRDPGTDLLITNEIPAAMPFGNTMPLPQGSIGLVLRWILAIGFSALAVLFGLATLCQVRSHVQ